jgi:malonyl-CoA O-methyltransferase
MKVDSYVHVNKFLDADIWKMAFVNEGIQFENFQVCDYILQYGDLSDLMYELKKLGAHNINSGQKKTMTNKKNIRNLINAYDQYRDPKGNLPVTWQVIFGIGVLGA